MTGHDTDRTCEAGPITYETAGLRVRDDLVAAHQRAWHRLAKSGTWWTGAERVAIARDVRSAAKCMLCSERAAALSPSAAAGAHEPTPPLSAAAVEAVHGITRDPGRLRRSWRDRLRTAGLDDGPYVELIGVVVTVVSIDAFCRGIGAPAHPLPVPLEGEPTRYRPLQASAGDAWVPMIPAWRATGAEADLWRRGMTGNVIRALSLVPDEVRTLKDLSAAHYLRDEQVANPGARLRHLTRSQAELLAARVSALHECFYCASSHTVLLRASAELEGTEVGLDAVVEGDADSRSGVRDGAALTAFAEALVRGDDAALAAARNRVMEAFGPAGLVEVAAVASNFTRMNRIANATGIALDAAVATLGSDLRDLLPLGRFASAAQTDRVGWLGRAVGALLRALLRAGLRLAARSKHRGQTPSR